MCKNWFLEGKFPENFQENSLIHWKIGCPELTTVFSFYKRNINKINKDTGIDTSDRDDLAMNLHTMYLYLSLNYPNLSLFIQETHKNQFQGLEQYLMDVVRKER